MFRTQANPMDDAVFKATDENLTSENWELILDVCDRVSANPSGPAHAVQSLIKRLAHRNANVQLYTLELTNALSQNCGPMLHRELASKAFTDALLRLVADRNTHAQVKQKVLERMGAWTDEFKGSPELGIMEQAYQRLRMQQPGLMPPSKPGKREISTEDRRKEEEELQMALALSVQDKGGVKTNGAGAKDDRGAQQSTTQASGGVSATPAQQGTTAATVSRVRALYDFTPSEPGELAFRKHDIIAVLESVYKDWWKGSLRGQTGIFPLNYVEKLQDPTKEELERDANMEAEVFGEIRNVEKLLALLSVREGGSRRGEREEEEISELYQRTLSIRPKLIELIGKYSQKKDDFTQLNEKFIKARRDYEALLESSMSQSQYQQQLPYHQPNRLSSYPQQPPSQQPYSQPPPQQPYSQQPPPQQAPPHGYPPQGPPAAGYPPQAPYAQQSQQHLPTGQQDPQRFYSPAPSEPPQQPPGYGSPYPAQSGPPPIQANGPAPFHFIPGGVQGAPPPGAQAPQEVRRKPSPQALASQPPNGPSDPYSAGPPSGGAAPPGAFQGQIRPNSIHTLNSGNPQELATGGYESPIDNRHSSYSTTHHAQPPQQQQQHDQYDVYGYPASHVPPAHDDRQGLPSRQRTHSFESRSSIYSTQQPDAGYAPHMPQAPPPGVPHMNPGGPQPAYGAYQAYNPAGAPPPSQQGAVGGGGDPGDYYR